MDQQVTPQTMSAVAHPGHAVTAEVCAECGSLDVRAVEPQWFTVGFDRRDELHEHVASHVEGLEFGCRDCGAHWS
ncbi:hypothetical protein [Microbacterium sp. P01]|uniref:hypothetical protein n=1 Tax=unclassified Microbacterium TaxID=2609290 RepID=UPI003671DC4D